MDDFLAGPDDALWGGGGWDSAATPRPVPELGEEEAEELNARLINGAPPAADTGPPRYEDDAVDDGPPQYEEGDSDVDVDPSWWSEQPEASASAAGAAPSHRVGGVQGKGIPGKGKWNNLPTTQPQRGRDGGATGHKRSGGQYASWYRQFYAIKRLGDQAALDRWLAAHPYPRGAGKEDKGGKGGGKGSGNKGGGKTACR